MELRVAQGFPDHFSSSAAAYAAHRPTYPEALIDCLARATARHELAWEPGCGSGQLASALRRRFARVIATDASAAQLALAVPQPGLEYRCELAEEPSLASGSVDLVVAAQAAHWFAAERFAAAVARVARPGAAIAYVGYGRPTFVLEPDDAAGRGMAAAFDALRDGVLGAFWPPERAHVEAGYRTLPFPWPELPAPSLVIEREFGFAELAGYVSTWSSARACRGAGAGPALDAALAALGAACERLGAPRRLRWPILLRLGRAA